MSVRSRPVVAIWLLALALAAAACGSRDSAGTGPGPEAGLRIAGFDFAESALLAELYAQVVESTGTPVVRLGPVGPREVVAPAMALDEIDLVPEYAGTLRAYLAPTEAPGTSSDAGLDVMLASRGLVALDAAPAEDANVVVVRADFASEHGLARIGDLAPIAVGLRFGGPPECPDRPLCLAGLEDVYGLEFAEFVVQPSMRFTAEALRRDEIDVGLMFSTDANLVSDDLHVLYDDRHLQPDENIVPVIRTDALDRWGPEVRVALDALSAALTSDGLRLLNRRLDDGEPVEEVARSFLRIHDLPGGG